MKKSALVFVHEELEGPGIFGKILDERGIRQRIIFTPGEDVTDFAAIVPDLVLVMGGSMGVYEADDYPFLKREIEFLKMRIKADRPTLGICLGSQLIAAALGSAVYKGKEGQEIGWAPLIKINKNHALRHLSGAKTDMFHWHGDTFDLPKGSVLLASSELYEYQAFSYGKNILALQFHPEITDMQIAEWGAASPKEIRKSKITGSMEEFRTHTEVHIDRMNAQSRIFFEEWLSSVGL